MAKKQTERETIIHGMPMGHYVLTIPRVIRHLELRATTKRLLEFYWELISATGRACSMGQRRIAKEAGISQPSVNRGNKELAEVGLLIVLKEGGRDRAGEVALDLDRLWDLNTEFARASHSPVRDMIHQRLTGQVIHGESPESGHVIQDESNSSSFRDISYLFKNVENQDAVVHEPGDGGSITGPNTATLMRVEIDNLFDTGPEESVKSSSNPPSPLTDEDEEAAQRKKKWRLKPPKGPSDFKKKSGPSIPQKHFVSMYRLCYMVDSTQAGALKLLGEREVGKVAQTVKIMFDAGANLERLHEFELWWLNQSISKDRESGDYRTPTPAEVRKYWGRAMAHRDKMNLGSRAALQSMEDRATEEKLRNIQQAFMESRR